MFPVDLIRHQDSELFFAVVGPVGSDTDSVCDGLANVLNRFKYGLHTIRVIAQLKRIKGYLKNEPEFYDKKLENRMDEGDRFRKETGRDDALALLALDDIRRFRGKNGKKKGKKNNSESETIPRQCYLFRSLKRPEEVIALRRIYGSNLVVIGIHSARDNRIENLAEEIARSRFSAQRDRYRDKAESLIIRDESDETREHGQQLRKAFALADLFLDSSNAQTIETEIERFLNLLFGKPVVTPTKDELGMAHAYVAALQSAELGRQVGAAIMDEDGSLIGVGTNEVPKAGGGSYFDGDSPDGRDWSKGFDSSDHYKKTNLGELLSTLSEKKYLRKNLQSLSTAKLMKKIAPVIKQTRSMQLIEFIRATHAEVSALMDAAGRGAPVKRCTMYVTTFPCHECARNIVSAGVARVVYIEPYAKSLALELHDNSIQLDKDTDPNKIPFTPFLGVSPRIYLDIFQMPNRKSKDGKLIKWEAATAHPRVSGSFWSYFQYEKEDLKFLRDAIKLRRAKLRRKKGRSR
ncbi:MAG: anti-phage dCTP deaminase [Candidatus Acidiferrum sp.]